MVEVESQRSLKTTLAFEFNRDLKSAEFVSNAVNFFCFIPLKLSPFYFYTFLFSAHKKIFQMSHDHHDDHSHGHQEAEQNEIGAPVLFALICAAAAVLIIYFLAK